MSHTINLTERIIVDEISIEILRVMVDITMIFGQIF